MGKVIYLKRQRKLTGDLKIDPKKSEITETNVVFFPVMERKAKTCQRCGLPFYEEVCPDCGPPNLDTDK